MTTRWPGVWVEEPLPGLRAVAEAERLILGDLDNWKPAGFIQREDCGREIRYQTPGGTVGSEPCDLAPDHTGDCDSSQLLVRRPDAAAAEQDLREWAEWNRNRDVLVRAALDAGVSKHRVHMLTGIARTTIDRITAR